MKIALIIVQSTQKLQLKINVIKINAIDFDSIHMYVRDITKAKKLLFTLF